MAPNHRLLLGERGLAVQELEALLPEPPDTFAPFVPFDFVSISVHSSFNT